MPIMTASWAFLLLFFCNLPFINGQETSLVFVSNTGTLNSRIFCREVIQCVGAGTDVFWSFFGLGSIRLTDTENRFVTTSQMEVNGTNFTTANLTFDPLVISHASIYVCQVVGPVPASTNIRVVVEGVPVVILSDIPDYDLSQFTIGDTITVTCQVETCLSDVTVTFYKDSQVLQTNTITNNNQMTLTFTHIITVAADSAGEYACRAVTQEGGTPNELFSLTGTPKSPSSSPSSSSSSSSSLSTSPSSTTNIGASGTMSVSTTATSTPTASSTSTTPTPTISSPAGASTLAVEWTLFVSLILITVLSLMI